MSGITDRLLNSYKVNSFRKSVYRLTHRRQEPRVIFIFGCQRSGTTITQRLIELDPQVVSYGEGDAPYFYQWPERANRLLDEEVIKVLLRSEKSPRVLLKPLYESQRAVELMSAFPRSQAVWVFRNYQDVIASHRSYYHHRDPRQYVESLLRQDSESWLGAHCSEELQALLKDLSDADLSVDDLYGLFWIARCELYWPLRDDPRVCLLDYDRLRESPNEVVDQLYEFMELQRRPVYTRLVRTGKPGQHDDQQLNPLIRSFCEELLARLKAVDWS